MTPAEAATLLAGIAAFDNRKPDEAAAKMWAHALDGLRLEDCAQAVVEHFKTSSEYLMPVHVRSGVKRIRAKRLAEHPPVIPPDDVTDFGAWLAGINRRIGDGETFDPNQFCGELKPRDMRELTSATDPADAVRNLRSQLRDRHDRAPAKKTDPEHARRKAEARAELDAMRAATTETEESA
jgi:hypothetical protein